MNHFYTEKLSFFRNSRFVFQQEVNKPVDVKAEKPKGLESQDFSKLGESAREGVTKREGRVAVEDGKNHFLEMQGKKGLERALAEAKKNPVDAFIKSREGMPNFSEVREAIANELPSRNPDMFLANADKLKTPDYSANLEKAVTNPNLSPATALAFAKVYEGQPYADAVIANAVSKADARTILSYAPLLKGKREYGKVLADAEKRDPIGAGRYA